MKNELVSSRLGRAVLYGYAYKGIGMLSRLIRAGITTLTIAFLIAAPVWAAGSGTITSLTASDAPDAGDSVRVRSNVRADGKINSSNLYYVIYAPDGVTVVATHTTNLPNLKAGDTFSDSWSTSNLSFPSIGTYTVSLCWSPGGSHNCSIDSATTTFYSVPSLGPFLSLVALALVVFWIWRRRHDFALETA